MKEPLKESEKSQNQDCPSGFYWIRDGYAPKVGAWHKVSDAIPDEDPYWGNDFRSIEVEIFDNGKNRIGYCLENDQDYAHDRFNWFLQGRDMYRTDGVTHWKFLSSPPKA